MSIGHRDFADLVRAGSRSDLQQLITTHVLRPDPECFVGEEQLHDEVKAFLAHSLRTKPENVTLVGSGSMGYTIAPNKFPKRFHEESDLDFAIISAELFDEAWNALLEWGHPIRRMVPRPEAQWFEARRTSVFWGWLDPANLKFSAINRPALLSALRDLSTAWFETFQRLGLEFPGTIVAERKASARLYRTEEHLVAYQYEGLRQLQHALLERQPDGVQ